MSCCDRVSLPSRVLGLQTPSPPHFQLGPVPIPVPAQILAQEGSLGVTQPKGPQGWLCPAGGVRGGLCHLSSPRYPLLPSATVGQLLINELLITPRVTSILPALLVAAPGVPWAGGDQDGSGLVLSLCWGLFLIFSHPKTSPEQEFLLPNMRSCRESGKLRQNPPKSLWGHKIPTKQESGEGDRAHRARGTERD